jgi:hypothetical protein
VNRVVGGVVGGAAEVGATSGGGELLSPHLTAFQRRHHAAPTVIWVRDDDGAVWTYALLGGP